MKKFSIYIGFGLLSLTALVMIGFLVVTFMATRLDVSNERLDAREEERSALEDRWIASHKSGPNDPLEDIEDNELIIDDIYVSKKDGTLDWSDKHGNEGTVSFYFNSDDSVSISERRSELPETVHDYRSELMDAIEEEKN